MTEYKELAARLRACLANAQATGENPTSQRALEYRIAEAASAIEAQQARIEAVEAERDEARTERDELIAWFDGLTPIEMHDSIKSQVDRARAAEARCKGLEEALRQIGNSPQPTWQALAEHYEEVARLALHENTGAATP